LPRGPEDRPPQVTVQVAPDVSRPDSGASGRLVAGLAHGPEPARAPHGHASSPNLRTPAPCDRDAPPGPELAGGAESHGRMDHPKQGLTASGLIIGEGRPDRDPTPPACRARARPEHLDGALRAWVLGSPPVQPVVLGLDRTGRGGRGPGGHVMVVPRVDRRCRSFVPTCHRPFSIAAAAARRGRPVRRGGARSAAGASRCEAFLHFLAKTAPARAGAGRSL